MVTLTLYRDECGSAIANVDLRNGDEMLVVLETGNEICIGRDEQGDTFVKIDNHEVWDNSNR